MSRLVVAWRGGAARPHGVRHACPASPETAFTFTREAFSRIEEDRFARMDHFYRRHGGCVSADELTRQMEPQWDQPITVLADWIARREVVNIVGCSRVLVPMFQFTLDDMRIRPVVGSVLAELRGVFDDREIAEWLMQPNGWLHDEIPLDVLSVDRAAVVGAARADRFIARG